MMSAVDQILAALEAQLAGVANSTGVYRKPFILLEEDDLNGIVIDEIEDEITEAQGFFPVIAQHTLRFDVVPLVLGTRASCLVTLGELHQAIETRLFGSRAALTLGGLINTPLRDKGAGFLADSETLQKPVIGWRHHIDLTYYTRSDKPGIYDRG